VTERREVQQATPTTPSPILRYWRWWLLAALIVGTLIGAALLVIYGAGGYVRYEAAHTLEFGPRKAEPPEKTPKAKEPWHPEVKPER
jgi:hypothetical protein